MLNTFIQFRQLNISYKLNKIKESHIFGQDMKSIWQRAIIILLVATSTTVSAQYDIANKAEKLLLRGKYQNAFQATQKAIEKDSTNVAGYQAFALYFTFAANTAYHVDSAHYYNLEAIKYYPTLDEKSEARLQKNHITLSYLNRFKIHIDSLAFQEALTNAALAGYNHYIGLYMTSHLLDSAIVLRNQLAFDRARDENTYHSYRAFMERYPEAIQIKEAKIRFEKLYYDESVKDGQLNSYYDFLEEHPQSVYRPLAEQQILELSTIDNSLSSYLSFAEKFPASSHSKTALDYAYHLSQEVPKISVSLTGYYDSLQSIHRAKQEVLIPFYNNGYGFINSQGEIIVSTSYKTATQKASKCPKLFENFIWSEAEEDDILLTKTGRLFWKGKYDQIKDLGLGLIAIIKGTQTGIIHKSGRPVLPLKNNNIKIVGRQFIAYQHNGLWGLTSALGRQLTQPIYQDIIGINDFILVKQHDKWAVSNSKNMKQVFSKPIDLSFIYTDYDVFDVGNLMVYEHNRVNIVSTNLSLALDRSTTDISSTQDGLITKDDAGYHLIDSRTNQELATSTSPILSNKLGTFYQDRGKWNLWEDQRSNELQCDSLALLGNHFIQYYQGDSVRFLPKTQRKFPKEVRFTSINQNNENYLLIKQDQSTILLDTIGRMLTLEAYDKISLAGDSLFIVAQNDLKGLLNSKGDVLLNISFDAIQRNDSVTFTLLKDSNFGLYNQVDNTQIPPTFTRRITIYDASLYIAHLDGFYGLLDHEGNTILPFEYDKIQYWNSSSALVKKGYQWIIVNIQANEPIIDQIDQFSELSSNAKGRVLKIYKKNGFGLLHSQKGELIPSSFYHINQNKQKDSVIYIAEKYIEEADFYVVVYYNSEGEVVFKHAMEAKHYQSMECETE